MKRLAAVVGLLFFICGSAVYAAPPPSPFQVDGNVALASLVSLSDGHIKKMADTLQLLAMTPEASTADWQRIKGPLATVGRVNVPAVLWFALPDGSYWTAEKGRVSENLRSRDYFPKLMAGQVVLGDLVVSKSTGKSTAIVAVPIKRGGTVVGALGSSIYLDRMSDIIRREMDITTNMIFYSFDSRPLVGLNWNPELIFLEPQKEGDPSLSRAFDYMLARDQGTVSYTFRGKPRTVIFRKSPVTGWWYAFGVLK